ncbi:MAG TPA: ATP-binding protein [Solirubrobacteraceae bacterium]|jgi:anti-sigma regulatory factor (Ser/Thr protein kinase)|nr:ATP-binding protein [Solirubrobacteraceae bacterium]
MSSSPHDPLEDAEPTSVRLTLPARPENVALARQVLAGVAEGLDIEEELLADINIAVTEACNNVVLHAYPDGVGTTEVTITSVLDQLMITVRDQGTGMNPFPAEADAGAGAGGDPDAPARLGFGFAMMSSLSDQFGINSGAGGTEVRMRFALHGAPAIVAEDLFDRAGLPEMGPAPQGDIVLVLTPGVPAAAVLGRYISLLAVRASLSIDRMSDLQLVSDALALHAPRRALNGRFHVAADGDESGFNLRVGPLQAGGSDAIVADATLAGVGSLLHLLSDDVASEPVSGGAPGAEVLRLRLTGAARRP